MANRFAVDRFTISATNSTFEIDVRSEGEKTFVVLAVSEA